MSSGKNIWEAAASGDPTALEHCLERRQKLPKTKRIPVTGLRDNHNWTLLHHATASGSLECVELLLSRTDVDERARCYEGRTALLLACMRNAPLAIVQRLLERDRALVNMGSNEFIMPLHEAVERGNLELVKVLLASEADVNAQDFAEETPLHAALVGGHVEIVIQLLFVAHACVPEGDDMLSIMAARGICDVRRKVACFKLLFCYMLSQKDREFGQRYRLEDIFTPALLSYRSVSLIPHFVETALRWESDADSKELIEFLQRCPETDFPEIRDSQAFEYVLGNRYHLLLLLITYRDEIALLDTQVVADSYKEIYPSSSWITKELVAFSLAALCNSNDEILRMLLKYLDKMKNLKYFITNNLLDVIRNLKDELISQETNQQFAKAFDRYEIIASRLVELSPFEADDLLLLMRYRYLPNKHVKYLRPIISYCTDFSHSALPVPDPLSFWPAVVMRYGPLQMAKNLEGFRMSEFTLLRLTRDAIRKAVLEAIPEDHHERRDLEFVRRLATLELPGNLLRYLRYL